MATPLRLTYLELAERLDVTVEAARIRARRRGWRVTKDNTGRKIVEVPETDLPDPRPDADQTGSDTDQTPSDPRPDVDQTLIDTIRQLHQAHADALARAAAAEASLQEVREALARERALVDDLRQPWLLRLWRSLR